MDRISTDEEHLAAAEVILQILIDHVHPADELLLWDIFLEDYKLDGASKRMRRIFFDKAITMLLGEDLIEKGSMPDPRLFRYSLDPFSDPYKPKSHQLDAVVVYRFTALGLRINTKGLVRWYREREELEEAQRIAAISHLSGGLDHARAATTSPTVKPNTNPLSQKKKPLRRLAIWTAENPGTVSLLGVVCGGLFWFFGWWLPIKWPKWFPDEPAPPAQVKTHAEPRERLVPIARHDTIRPAK